MSDELPNCPHGKSIADLCFACVDESIESEKLEAFDLLAERVTRRMPLATGLPERPKLVTVIHPYDNSDDEAVLLAFDSDGCVYRGVVAFDGVEWAPFGKPVPIPAFVSMGPSLDDINKRTVEGMRG